MSDIRLDVREGMQPVLDLLGNNRRKTHGCCYHTFRGVLFMVVPDGHTVQKCCGCENMRTVHVEHAQCP